MFSSGGPSDWVPFFLFRMSINKEYSCIFLLNCLENRNIFRYFGSELNTKKIK